MDDSKNDPFAPMEEMMKGVPGGDYFLMMMRNNPEARDALTSIDPSDPESMFTALRRVLGAFGIGGPQADLLLGQARQMMNDPESMQRMMASQGMQPPGAPAPAPTEPAASPEAGEDAGAGDAPSSGGPPWADAASRAEALIEDGRERAAFELMTGVLDLPELSAWDPRDPVWEGVDDLLEVFACESQSAGRLLPIRFASLYARWALANDVIAPVPATNPAFTEWAVQVAEHVAAQFDDDEDAE
jgi:hypothetical protein